MHTLVLNHVAKLPPHGEAKEAGDEIEESASTQTIRQQKLHHSREEVNEQDRPVDGAIVGENKGRSAQPVERTRDGRFNAHIRRARDGETDGNEGRTGRLEPELEL